MENKEGDLTENGMMKGQEREHIIVRTSVVGIMANALLAAFKAFVGAMTGSIAIVMDAVNNLSDAASSMITIIGTKLAGKPADSKHPFGYGRIEYLSAMVISVIILYAGVTSLTESVKKIIHPERPSYTAVSLIIVAVAVAVKVLLGRYVKKTGEKVNSGSLINSGTDATLDSIISASTLAAAAIFIFTGVSLEAWLGAVISAFIIKSGIDMLRETLSEILGERADVETARKIKEIVTGFPEVKGAYDLILHNYGPDRFTGSVHIEVPDTMDADSLDQLIREITVKVYLETDIILTGVGIYSINTKDDDVIEMRDDIFNIALSHENIIQVHGFYADREKKTIRLDIVVSFDEKDRYALFSKVKKEIEEKYPDYTVTASMDTDFSES